MKRNKSLVLDQPQGEMVSADGSAMAITDIGLRPENQDIAVIGDNMIAVVDGFGGQTTGQLAARALANYLASYHEHSLSLQDLCDRAQAKMPPKGGATLGILRRRYEGGRVFVDGGVFGDAKAYIIDTRATLRDALLAVSLDQSTVQVYINTRLLEPLDRYTYETRNIIQNCVASNRHIDFPSRIVAEGRQGQLMAIAVSDGVSDFVTPEEVTMLALEHGPDCGRAIFKLAQSRQNREKVEILLNGKKEVIPKTSSDNTTIATMVC